jgi:hypothetical protein
MENSDVVGRCNLGCGCRDGWFLAIWAEILLRLSAKFFRCVGEIPRSSTRLLESYAGEQCKREFV